MEIGGIRKKRDTVRFPVCLGQEDTKHILLSCLEKRMWRKGVISRKQLYINEEVAYKKILMCGNKSLIIYLGRYAELNSTGLIR
jgi:hypothetical protein